MLTLDIGMTAAPKFKMDNVTPTTPLEEVLCHTLLGLATINVPTKFEVTISPAITKI